MSRDYSKRLDRPGAAGEGQSDTLPPHSVEAERGVLGCVMLSPESCLNECEEFGVQPDWFYDLRHRLIYGVVEKIWRGKVGSPSPRPSPPGEGEGHAGSGKGGVDLITVVNGLLGLGKEAEGQDWISVVSGLEEGNPGPALLPSYLEILREKWQGRGLVRVCVDTVNEVYGRIEVKEGPPEAMGTTQLLARVEKEVQRLAAVGEGSHEVRLREAVVRVLAKLGDYHRGHAQIHGLTTGLSYLDKLLCGIGGENGNYFVVSGRPGTGKTSWVVQLAMHVACDYVWFDPVLMPHGQNGQLMPVMETVRDADGKERDKFKCERRVGKGVGIFSLEMAEGALVSRMLFQRAGADMQRYRTGFALAETQELLARSARELAKPDNVIIDDTARMTIETIRGRARRWVRQEGVGLIIVDYVQLVRSGGKRFREDRRQELEEISAEFQALGKELNVPFVILAQMNRDFEKEVSRQPRLSDLKDCGSIEQDADVVGFLYRPKLRPAQEQIYEAAMDRVYQRGWNARPIRVNAIFQKNRYGPTGVCELLFEKSCTRFLDYREWLKEHGSHADGQSADGAEEPGTAEES